MIADKTLRDVADWALVPDPGLARAMALELIDMRQQRIDLREQAKDSGYDNETLGDVWMDGYMTAEEQLGHKSEEVNDGDT